MNEVDKTKELILEAANARFGLYGYNKTTMAEIASDCNMSAGNLYRFFKNKTEIVAECASTHFKQCETLMRAIVRQRDISVSEKLDKIGVEGLRFSYDIYSSQPKISELVEHITLERSDIIHTFHNIKTSLIAELLAEGNRVGDFDIADVRKSAEVVMCALSPFHALPVLLLYIAAGMSLDDLEKGVGDMVNLILNGLKRRS